MLPRGGIVSSPRLITAISAVRGSPSSRTAEPLTAWSPATAKSTSSSLLSGPTSSGASCTGGAGASSPSRPATHSSVVPCTIAETTTTKKTALKIVSFSGTSEERTNVASTIGTAPRRPAQPSRSRSRLVKSWKAVDAQTDAGRATSISSSASASPASGHVRQVRGEDEQAEDDEERDLGGEREPLVEGDEVAAVAGRRAADREADQVDREEAAAADHVGDAERERRRRERRHRREGADRVRQARRRPMTATAPSATPTTRPRPSCWTTSRSRSSMP